MWNSIGNLWKRNEQVKRAHRAHLNGTRISQCDDIIRPIGDELSDGCHHVSRSHSRPGRDLIRCHLEMTGGPPKSLAPPLAQTPERLFALMLRFLL